MQGRKNLSPQCPDVWRKTCSDSDQPGCCFLIKLLCGSFFGLPSFRYNEKQCLPGCAESVCKVVGNCQINKNAQKQ